MSEKLAIESLPSFHHHSQPTLVEVPPPPKLRTGALQRWWPATQSLDLVEGPVEQVAAAVQSEVGRFLGREALNGAWKNFANLEEALSAAPDFVNVPTFFLVLPTRSPWTVLWNNSFLCDGYDSLCWCLTHNHHFRTLHWSAHDEWTSFQAGVAYYHRRWDGAKVVQRSVEAAQHDKTWTFYENGDPIPEEDINGYRERKKRHRLSEAHMVALLSRLGASPWQEDFYAVSEAATFVLTRDGAQSGLLHRSREEVLRTHARAPSRSRARRVTTRQV